MKHTIYTMKHIDTNRDCGASVHRHWNTVIFSMGLKDMNLNLLGKLGKLSHWSDASWSELESLEWCVFSDESLESTLRRRYEKWCKGDDIKNCTHKQRYEASYWKQGLAAEDLDSTAHTVKVITVHWDSVGCLQPTPSSEWFLKGPHLISPFSQWNAIGPGFSQKNLACVAICFINFACGAIFPSKILRQSRFVSDSQFPCRKYELGRAPPSAA